MRAASNFQRLERLASRPLRIDWSMFAMGRKRTFSPDVRNGWKAEISQGSADSDLDCYARWCICGANPCG